MLSLQNRELQTYRVEITKRVMSDHEKAIAVAVQVALVVVEEDMPLAQFKALMQLQNRLGTPNEHCHFVVLFSIYFNCGPVYEISKICE